MQTNLKLVSRRNVSFGKAVRARHLDVNQQVEKIYSEKEYNLLLEAGIFDKPSEIQKPIQFKAVGLPNNEVEISYKAPHWEIFENNVWKLFVQMEFEHMNLNKFGISINPSSSFQANGIFSDSDLVFLCRTLYKTKTNGQDTKGDSLKNDVSEWMKPFSQVSEFLQAEFLELKDKRFIPLVLTRGYHITHEEKKELEDEYGVYLINDRFVQELERIAGKNGKFAKTVLCQELFRGEPLPYEVPQFNALMENIDGAKVYTFFAKANEVVDTVYVHRRLPQDTGFAMAYQRMVKPDKVQDIGTYLEKSGSFFPNSIVVSIKGENFTTIEGNMGRLKLPNIYGNMWIIDGQHRLYGSAFSEQSKPVPICAIEGLDGLLQAEQFTSINSNQTTVSKDLIWDLKGELYHEALHDMSSSKEVQDMRRQYFVSNVWKRINQNHTNPLSNRLKIPSQSPNESLGLGTMCRLLDKKTIWKNGHLIRKSDPEQVVEDVSDLIMSMLEGMSTLLSAEFEKPTKGSRERKNWVLTTYSMEVIMMAFNDAVIYFSSSESHKEHWHSDDAAKEKMHQLGNDLAEVIMSPDYGFFAQDKDIRKAGNASIRKDYYSDLVIALRDSSPDVYSPEFAPGVGFEDFTSLKISPKIKRRIEELEFKLRAACISVLELEGPKKITKYLNSKYQSSISRGLDQERNWSDTSLFNEEKKFEYLSFSELFEIMLSRYSKFSFKVKKNLLDERFKDVLLIRNMIAHPRDFPNHNAKKSWISSLDQTEEWFKQMVIRDDES